MSEDLRPAPRLPLDTADYVDTQVNGLHGYITFEPGEPVYQVSLLQTRSPYYWPSAFDRQVYDKDLVAVFDNERSAFIVVGNTLSEFSKENPRPPQFPGTST